MQIARLFLIFLLENSQKYIFVTPEGKSGVVPVHSLTRDGSCVLCMQEEKPKVQFPDK